jgi:hypothetical protein
MQDFDMPCTARTSSLETIVQWPQYSIQVAAFHIRRLSPDSIARAQLTSTLYRGYPRDRFNLVKGDTVDASRFATRDICVHRTGSARRAMINDELAKGQLTKRKAEEDAWLLA